MYVDIIVRTSEAEISLPPPPLRLIDIELKKVAELKPALPVEIPLPVWKEKVALEIEPYDAVLSSYPLSSSCDPHLRTCFE